MNDYFYLDTTNRQQGPVSADRLPSLGVTPTTFVWTQGMDEWKRAADVPEIAALLTPPPTVTPPPLPLSAAAASPRATLHEQTYTPEGMEDITTWAVVLIVVSFICCTLPALPFGVIALIDANRAEKFLRSGLTEEAKAASSSARRWCIVATCIIGACLFVLPFLLFLW